MGIALAIAVVAIAAAIGIGFGVTNASAASSKVVDAHNDQTSGPSGLDIKDASVTKSGDEFEFSLKLAGSVSDAMVGTNQWNFIIDSNSDCQEWLFCGKTRSAGGFVLQHAEEHAWSGDPKPRIVRGR